MGVRVRMKCPDCGKWTKFNTWALGGGNCEVPCEDCGEHPGFHCEHCDAYFDLIFKDDIEEEQL